VGMSIGEWVGVFMYISKLVDTFFSIDLHVAFYGAKIRLIEKKLTFPTFVQFGEMPHFFICY
jgi:hypothetical protein